MQVPFSAAPHDDVLALLVQIALLLLTARLLGALAQKMKQPSVAGEIAAGVLLGPSVLGRLWPAAGAWIVPTPGTQGYLLETVSLIGAMFLLLITGMEMDLRLIRQRARTAIGVSVGGVAVCMASGFWLGWYLPDWARGPSASQLVFALFLAIAMSISAIPVIAKVLIDLKMLRRDIGQTIIAAGMSDDTIGWILLSAVAALAVGETVTVGSTLLTIGKVVGFIVVSLTLGRWVVDRIARLIIARFEAHSMLVTLVVGLAFLFGAVAQALHFEAVLGAFVLGLVVGQIRRIPHAVVRDIESVGLSVFAPIFFAVAGLKVDVLALTEPRLLWVTALVVSIACLGKVVGTYLGARLIGGAPHWNALAFGAGLNARGAMEILIATIGLRLGILSTDIFSVIVVMAIATSLIAPPSLRFVLRRVQPDDDEKARLAREALEKTRRLRPIQRALVPMRRRTASDRSPTRTVEAWVVSRLDRTAAITLAGVAKGAEKAQTQEYLTSLRPLFDGREIAVRVLDDDDPSRAIVAEAARGYDVVVVGAPEGRSTGDGVFSRVIDDVVRGASCATVVVRGAGYEGHFPPKRILVPVSGSAASQAAAEFAALIAGADVAVDLLQIVVPSNELTGQRSDREVDAARQFLEHLATTCELSPDRSTQTVRVETDVEAAVLAAAANADLLVLGASVLPGTAQLYLGPRVGLFLERSPCPVLVVNS